MSYLPGLVQGAIGALAGSSARGGALPVPQPRHSIRSILGPRHPFSMSTPQPGALQPYVEPAGGPVSNNDRRTVANNPPPVDRAPPLAVRDNTTNAMIGRVSTGAQPVFLRNSSMMPATSRSHSKATTTPHLRKNTTRKSARAPTKSALHQAVSRELSRHKLNVPRRLGRPDPEIVQTARVARELLRILYDPAGAPIATKLGGGIFPTEVMRVVSTVVTTPAVVTSGSGAWMAAMMFPSIYYGGAGTGYWGASSTSAIASQTTNFSGALTFANAPVGVTNVTNYGGSARLLAYGFEYSIGVPASVPYPLITGASLPGDTTVGAIYNNTTINTMIASAGGPTSSCQAALTGRIVGLPTGPTALSAQAGAFGGNSFCSDWSIPVLSVFWPGGASVATSAAGVYMMVKYTMVVEVITSTPDLLAPTQAILQTANKKSVDPTEVYAELSTRGYLKKSPVMCGIGSLANVQPMAAKALAGGTSAMDMALPSEPPSGLSTLGVQQLAEADAKANVECLIASLPILRQQFPDLPPYNPPAAPGVDSAAPASSSAPICGEREFVVPQHVASAALTAALRRAVKN